MTYPLNICKKYLQTKRCLELKYEGGEKQGGVDQTQWATANNCGSRTSHSQSLQIQNEPQPISTDPERATANHCGSSYGDMGSPLSVHVCLCWDCPCCQVCLCFFNTSWEVVKREECHQNLQRGVFQSVRGGATPQGPSQHLSTTPASPTRSHATFTSIPPQPSPRECNLHHFMLLKRCFWS